MNTRGIAAEYRLGYWAEALQSRIAEGMSIEAFCQNRGISKNTYFYWQRKIREAAYEQLALRQTEAVQASQSGFTEVKVAESRRLPETFQAGRVQVDWGGAQMTFDSSYPHEKLAALIRELTRP